MTPSIYPGLAMEEYLTLPAFSASIARAMTDRCPRAAWYDSWLNVDRVRESSEIQDAGSVAHEILLEGSESCCCVIDPNDHPVEKTGAIPKGWTNKSIKAARDAARADGKIPILAGDMDSIRAMVASAQRFIDSLRKTEPAVWAAFQPDGGRSEITITWDEDGLPCKMRPDRISSDNRIIIDAKFTGVSAEPDSWGRVQMTRMGYYVSAAFYRLGIQRAYGVAPDYLFLVTETMPPYLSSLVGVDPAGFDLGEQKVLAAMTQWRRCVERNWWPGYVNRVVYPEMPPWETARWEGRLSIPDEDTPAQINYAEQA